MVSLLIIPLCASGWPLTGALGDIGVAWTEDDPREGKWTYQQVVLHEPFHLSYPFGALSRPAVRSHLIVADGDLSFYSRHQSVFFHDGYYWMIPEAHQSNQIRYISTAVPF